jgi:hypothetical protein
MKTKKNYISFLLAGFLGLFLSCNIGISRENSHSVVYEAPDADPGTVPVDTQAYAKGDSVTIASGETLARAEYQFASWNTKRDGMGTPFLPGAAYEMGSSDLVLYARWIKLSELRAAGTTPSGEIGFYVSGGSIFCPLIETHSGAEIIWQFTGYDGGFVTGDVSSIQAAPSTSYTGKMLATLKVTPWSALRTIDIGYDGGDSGTLTLEEYRRDQQGVASVDHLDLAKEGLEIWCSSHNTDLKSLSFNGFEKLKIIEAFFNEGGSAGLESIDLSGTSALVRLCLENNNLASLDLSDCSLLEDLRGAQNAYSSIVWPDSMMNLWHVCVRDNSQFKENVPIEEMPALKEYFLWNDSQTGTLAPISHSLSSILIWGNSYTAIDLTNAAFASGSKDVIASNCEALDSVLVGDSGVSYLGLDGCGLDSAAIAALLSDLATTNGVTGGTLILTRNPANVDATSSDYAKLTEDMGWTITE